MEVKKLKQVEIIANKYFRCIVKPNEEVSTDAKGARLVKLFVGYKNNPAYLPNIDPNNPPPEYAGNKALLDNVTNPKAPDWRLIKVLPGMDEKELAKVMMRIKKSLETKKPVIDETITASGVEEESDADIAAKWDSGEKVDSRFDEFEDGFEEGEELPEDMEKLPDKEDNQPQIAEALKQISDNMETLANDINAMNDGIMNIEGRVDDIERGRKVKKTKPKAN